jgi:hypothetical protein
MTRHEVMDSLIIVCAFVDVIPAKAGIQFDRKMDARLRTSGMTEKGNNP